MSYFSKDYLDFFRELAANNYKEWFDENRKRYKKSVKDPFDNFVSDLIREIKIREGDFDLQTKDAVFRINRDIRFSQDKSPYKLDRSAVISPMGRKNHSYPGFYLSFGPEFATFGGGSYNFDPSGLTQMRTFINDNYAQFDKTLQDQKFKNTYGEIKGEEAKRLPKELQAENKPLLYRKQFYYMANLPAEIILRDNLMKIALEHYDAGRPLQEFLRQGTNS